MHIFLRVQVKYLMPEKKKRGLRLFSSSQLNGFSARQSFISRPDRQFCRSNPFLFLPALFTFVSILCAFFFCVVRHFFLCNSNSG